MFQVVRQHQICSDCEYNPFFASVAFLYNTILMSALKWSKASGWVPDCFWEQSFIFLHLRLQPSGHTAIHRYYWPPMNDVLIVMAIFSRSILHFSAWWIACLTDWYGESLEKSHSHKMTRQSCTSPFKVGYCCRKPFLMWVYFNMAGD